MADGIAEGVKWAITHWKALAGVLGPTGMGAVATRWAIGRLKPDKQSYIEVLDQLDQAADAIDQIVGRASTLDADCDHCRAANKHRRRAGEEIQSMFRGERFNEFTGYLRAADRALGQLEDTLLAEPHSGAAIVRGECVRVSAAVAEVRQKFRRKCDGRWSLLLHGRGRGKD